jgi:predicted PhzF superfamily epimerase YddE/YHI9
VSVPLFQVDAFAERPFAGNPAAVCLLAAPADPAWMQHVAAEMNLAETAFLWPEGDGYRLRWFTPRVEVDLCGHATLASAHVLWETGREPAGRRLRFQTRSGELAAARRGDEIELDFPAEPPSMAGCPPALAAALGVRPRGGGRNRLYHLVEVDSARAVRELSPDLARLRALDEVFGVMVTAPGDQPGVDFVSRFFAPRAGIDEDPVTGSAHSCLGPFWGARLGKRELVGYQASARGGLVRVRLAGERAHLGGRAVTVAPPR